MTTLPIKSDSFNRLLTSLSKSEKRYLKLHMQNSREIKDWYYTYFLAYENALKNKDRYLSLPSNFPVNRMPSIKNYLKGKILSILARFHQKLTKRNEIIEQLIHVEIFFNKRLYKECAKLLRHLENQALNYWSYNLLLEIYQWQLRLLLSDGYNGELKISFSDLYKKEQKLISSLTKISFYRRVRYKLLDRNSQHILTNPVSENHIENIKEILFRKKNKDLLPYASVEYYRTMSLYYRFTNDFVKSFANSQKEMAIWSKNFKIINNRLMTSKYVNGYINYCELLFFMESYDLCTTELEKLQQNLVFIDKQHNNHIRYLGQLHLLEISLNLAKHKYAENELLILNIEKTYLDKVNKQKVSEFLYFFLIHNFYQKKWRESLDYASKMINEYRNYCNDDIICLAEFFRILIHFEIKNMEVMENLISHFKYGVPEINSLFNHLKEVILYKKTSNKFLNASIKIILNHQKKVSQLYLKCYYSALMHWINHRFVN